MDGYLDARGGGEGFSGAASGVADFADGDVGVAEVEFLVGDAQVVGVGGDGGKGDGFGFRCTVVLDFDFEVEWRHSGEGDWDDFFAFGLARAVAVSLPRTVESCLWKSIDLLLKCNRLELLRIMIVVVVSEMRELVLIESSLRCVGAD
jgi:hypothetical protein